MGACAGDVDNDGRIDLYVTNYGANALYHNDGDGAFTDVTRDARRRGSPRWSTSCAFLDVDRDGDLDLFVTNYLDAPPSNNRFCGDPQRAHSRLLPSAQLHAAAERALSQRRQGHLHRRQRRRRASPRTSATVSASPSATTTMTGWPDCSSPTTACRTSCFTTRAADVSARWRCGGRRGRDATASRAPAWAPSSPTTTATAGSIWSSPTTSSRRTACSATTAAALFADATSRAGSARRRCRSSASASRSSTSTTTAPRPGDRQRPRHRQHRSVPPGLDARAAQAAVSEHERAGGVRGGGPQAGPGFAARDGRTHAHRGRHRQRRRRRSARHEQRRPARLLRNDDGRDRHAIRGSRRRREAAIATASARGSRVTARGRTQMREVEVGIELSGAERSASALRARRGHAHRAHRRALAGWRRRDHPGCRRESDRDGDGREGAHGAKCVRSLKRMVPRNPV